jgi:hypothetical protein
MIFGLELLSLSEFGFKKNIGLLEIELPISLT